MKTVTLRTNSGTAIRKVELVKLSEPERRRTHNRTTFFTYQEGWDAQGNKYSVSSAGLWRHVWNQGNDAGGEA